jgi:hypothetical protein
MSTCLYSQTNYPKKIIIKNDTCILITSSQLIKINYKLQYKNYLVDQNRDLKLEALCYKSFLIQKDTIIANQKKILLDYDNNAQKQLNQLEQLAIKNSELNHKLTKKKKRNNYLLGALAVLSLLTVSTNL